MNPRGRGGTFWRTMAETQVVPRLDERALVRLVRAHQAGIWRYLRFLGCDEEQAGDLTQETFVRLWRSGFEEHDDGRTRVFLRRVARNLVIDASRRARVRPAFRDLEAVEPVWAASEGDDDGEAYRLALRACLDLLAERARLVLRLFYQDGQSRVEIARTMDMTANGVKTLMRRTRESLRDCIERTVAT